MDLELSLQADESNLIKALRRADGGDYAPLLRFLEL
jgi:hypothetical protein